MAAHSNEKGSPGNQKVSDTTANEAQPRVAILYERDQPIDEQVLILVELGLASNGYPVFVDRSRIYDMEWATQIEEHLRSVQVIIPLISQASVRSELVTFQIELAHEIAQRTGKPKMIPVTLNDAVNLPPSLQSMLGACPTLAWCGPQDDQRLIHKMLERLKETTQPKEPIRIVVNKGLRLLPRQAAPFQSVPPALENIGGAMPLRSDLYQARPADAEVTKAISRFDSIILIKGARQMGKSSMLARGLQFARERGAKVVLTDFQKFNAANTESIDTFFLSMAESIADQLELPVHPSELWDNRRGANVNFERFMRKEVLSRLNAPLVWGLDEVDRLFVTAYATEVFGLFRSWHNERALDPSGPWAGLTLLIAYATEAHLFISDVNQSPFNVGTRVTLEDFTKEQVRELNFRSGKPLSSEEDFDRFFRLLNGHPFLVRRGLNELASRRIDLQSFETESEQDGGIYGDHLKRMLLLLARDPGLQLVVANVLRGLPCTSQDSFYRLRSAGVMRGHGPEDIAPRCDLYHRYLSRHLLK